jgi:hypothetical protein
MTREPLTTIERGAISKNALDHAFLQFDTKLAAP